MIFIFLIVPSGIAAAGKCETSCQCATTGTTADVILCRLKEGEGHEKEEKRDSQAPSNPH
jgi:hypothetical protein